VGVEQLYAFAQEYLAGLPPDVQVQTYAQYLASTHGNRVTAEDVKELLRYGADLPYRKARMLEEMTGDANFAGRMQKHWMFDSFCRHFDFTKEQGFEWVMTHHPQALEHLDGIPIPALIRHLRSRKMRAQPGERGRLDRALAAAIAREEPSRWAGLSQLRTFFDGQALNGWGFASFNAFQAWARKSAPMSFEASTKLAATVAQRIEALEAEEEARRTAANNRRKATRAAKKAGAQGASR
jgi:hypothetical protein